MPRDDEPDRTHNQYKLDKESKEALVRAVNRIEKLEQERMEVGEDIRAEYAHLKAAGYDATAIRELVGERKKRKKLGDKFEEREQMRDLYRAALGV